MEEENIKSKYGELQAKLGLPEFSRLDEFFAISKIDSFSDKVLRDVRLAMMSKVNDYTRLVELLINPSSAPPMFMYFVKNLTNDDRSFIHEVYEKFVSLELDSLDVDLEYNESSEAELIKNIYSLWSSSVPSLKKIVGIMKKNFSATPNRKERNYFG